MFVLNYLRIYIYKGSTSINLTMTNDAVGGSDRISLTSSSSSVGSDNADLEIGAYIQFGGSSGIYTITGIISRHHYSIYPPLEKNIAQGMEINYREIYFKGSSYKSSRGLRFGSSDNYEQPLTLDLTLAEDRS